MSNESFDPQRHKEIQGLRSQLTRDLYTFLAVDVHVVGFIVEWLRQNLDVNQLEDLVDELDGAYRVNGLPILDRKRSQPPPESDRL